MKAWKQDADRQNNICTLVIWLVLCTVSMSVMLYAASRKTIVIAETTQEQKELNSQGTERTQEMELQLQDTKGESGSFRIPLEADVKAENVILENHPIEQELWIYLKDTGDSFYSENAIQGDISVIQAGACTMQKAGVLLRLSMKGIWEYRSVMEEQNLEISFYEPHELYSMVVVVHTRTDTDYEKVLPEVAKLLPGKIEPEDIKVYLTCLEEEECSREQCIQLVKGADADIFLTLGFARNEEQPGQYGIEGYYNEEYYIPEFGNVELADTVTRNVTVAASNRAIGLFPAAKDSILQELSIPAAQINLGFVSNESERKLLTQTSYQSKLADGIANAIMEVYEKYGK